MYERITSLAYKLLAILKIYIICNMRKL